MSQYRTLTSDGHLSEQSTAVAQVTRRSSPADRFRSDASLLYLFSVAVLFEV